MNDQPIQFGILSTVERLSRLAPYQGYAPYALFLVDEDTVAALVSNKLLEERKCSSGTPRGLRLSAFGRRVLDAR